MHDGADVAGSELLDEAPAVDGQNLEVQPQYVEMKDHISGLMQRSVRTIKELIEAET